MKQYCKIGASLVAGSVGIEISAENAAQFPIKSYEELTALNKIKPGDYVIVNTIHNQNNAVPNKPGKVKEVSSDNFVVDFGNDDNPDIHQKLQANHFAKTQFYPGVEVKLLDPESPWDGQPGVVTQKDQKSVTVQLNEKDHRLVRVKRDNDANEEMKNDLNLNDNNEGKFSETQLELIYGMDGTGVDPRKMEQYLSDPEFQQVMGMSKADFAKLPKWKKQQLKKKVDLF